MTLSEERLGRSLSRWTFLRHPVRQPDTILGPSGAQLIP
jgi:hypothetical protein